MVPGSSPSVDLIKNLGLWWSELLLLRGLSLHLPSCFVRCRLHDLLLALPLYLRPVGVLHLRVGHLRRTLRHFVGLQSIVALLEEQIAASGPLSVLPLPLVHPLLPLPVILVVQVLRALPEVILSPVLILDVLVVYLILAAQVGEVVVIDVVIENVSAALLVLVHVVVQVILGGGDELSHGHVVLVVDVVLNLRMADGNGRFEAALALTPAVPSRCGGPCLLPHGCHILLFLSTLTSTLPML